ncbi:Hypothetical protein D9617_21g097130 [Elsinoe fawcettii]|nr:Hypothetical protein D9617_21g097130 [Elsinoe fawcettii]
MASYLQAMRLAKAAPHGQHKRKYRTDILADLVLGPHIATSRPDSTFYLVRSKDGRPLDLDTLAARAGYRQAPAAVQEHADDKVNDAGKSKDKKDKKHKQRSRTHSPKKVIVDPKAEGKRTDEKKNDTASPAATSDDANKDAGKLTAEQDVKLIEMKGRGKTWKEIVEELKKDKEVVQARWREIDPAKHPAPIEGAATEAPKQNDSDPKADDTWTPEQDAKLIEMKGSNKSWKEIGDEIKKDKHTLTARWKEINPAKTNAQANSGAVDTGKQQESAAKDNDDKEGDEKKETNGDTNKNNGNKVNGNQDTTNNHNQSKKSRGKQPQLEPTDILVNFTHGIPTPPASIHSHRSSRSYTRKRRDEPRLTLTALTALLNEDNHAYTAEEIKDLWAALDEDEEEKWLRVASRFYDAKGRRIDAEDIREKVRRMLERM